jgi:hypothetical protein
MVDVAGIEPATPCLQNKSAGPRNALHLNGCSENQALNTPDRMCAAVSGCARLIAGSLQKPLQFRGPPDREVSRTNLLEFTPPTTRVATPGFFSSVARGITILADDEASNITYQITGRN